MFGGVFFASKSLLGIQRQRKLQKVAMLTRKPWIDFRILIYPKWPIRFPKKKAILYSTFTIAAMLYSYYKLRRLGMGGSFPQGVMAKSQLKTDSLRWR